jgi:hypothetical protein
MIELSVGEAIIAGWVFVALLCAVIARRKGRTSVGWALLGLAFGVFALVLVVALPTTTRREAERRLAVEREMKFIEYEREHPLDPS